MNEPPAVSLCAGGLDPELPQYEESINGQRLWLMKATKYLETRADYYESMPHDWRAGTEEPEPQTEAKVSVRCLTPEAEMAAGV